MNPLSKPYTLDTVSREATSPYSAQSGNPAKRVKPNNGCGGDGTGRDAAKYFEVLYRIPQTRKHKTWDGDGILMLIGKKGHLRDEGGENKDKGEVTGRAERTGDMIKVGAFEVQICEPTSAAAFHRSIQPPLRSEPIIKPSYVPPRIITGGLSVTNSPSLHRKSPLFPKRANSPTKALPLPTHAYRRHPPPTIDLDPSEAAILRDGDARSPQSKSTSEVEVVEARKSALTSGFKAVIGVKRKAAELDTGDRDRGKEEDWKYFSVQYRKPQQKKHKTWEADGILVVDLLSNGTLYQADKKIKIAVGNISKKSLPLREDKELFFGELELLVASSIRPSSFISGDIFSSSKTLKRSVSALDAPITSSFFAATTTTSSFHDPIPGSLTSSRHPGVSKNIPKPRHDPKREGAVVMPRPKISLTIDTAINPRQLEVNDVVLDPFIVMKLLDHQKEGVQFMYECVMGLKEEGCEGCILADEMGLGKTVQAITLIWTLLRQSMFFGGGAAIKRALIVCPKTLTRNWEKEFRKWLGRDRVRMLVASKKDSIDSLVLSSVYEVVIISYDLLRINIEKLEKCRPKFGLLVCDEGHKLKNTDSQIAIALKRLDCRRRILLTGTPIQNNLAELHALMGFVNPQLLGSYAEFKKHFEGPITQGDGENCSETRRELAQERRQQLKSLVDPFMLRRTNEVMKSSLPPIKEYIVLCKPAPLQHKIFDMLLSNQKKEELQNMSEGTAAAMSFLSLLRKISNSPGLLMHQKESKNTTISSCIKSVKTLLPPGIEASDATLSGKFHVLANMLKYLHNKTEEKIVIVSNFTTTLTLIEDYCRKVKYRLCRLDGQTPDTERQAIVNSFNTSSRRQSFIMLLSSKAGGMGLTITGASRLVLFDPDWNPSNDAQAMARIHRKGQQRPCFLYRLQSTGTIDERIYQRQIVKTGLASIVMSEGKDANIENTMSLDEIRRLFTYIIDTDCNTHDLLQCTCLPTSKSSDNDDLNNEDKGRDVEMFDKDGEKFSGFVPASTYRPDTSSKKEKEESRRLEPLKQFSHHRIASREDGEDVEDACLRYVIQKGFQEEMRGRGKISFVFGTKKAMDEKNALKEEEASGSGSEEEEKEEDEELPDISQLGRL